MNTFKTKKKLQQGKKLSGGIKRSAGLAGRFMRALLGGEMLQSGTFRYLPFLIFIAAIAFIYITNNYHAENKVRKINRLRTELKELRYEYITSKSNLMNQTKQSQLATKLKKSGIRESTDPIRAIRLNDEKP